MRRSAPSSRVVALLFVALLVVALAASACSSRAPVHAPDFANGTRLAVRFDEAPGVKIFRVFHDTELDADCQFRITPDGARCLPVSALANGWFADAACSEPLAEMPPTAPLDPRASAVVDEPVNACSDDPVVRALGKRYDAPKAYQVSSKDGSCALLPVHGAALYRIGAVVPLARFVHAEPRVETVTDRVGAVVLVADDGSRQTVFGYEQGRGEWSYGVRTADGQRRWWPVHVAFNYGQGTLGTPGTVYDDAACAQPLAVKEAHNALCPITSVVEFGAPDACGQYRPRIHAAGPMVAADTLYEQAGDGSCHALAGGGDSGAIYVEMGALVADDQLVAATVVDVGSGRIVERFDGTPDGVAVLPEGELYDRERAQSCVVTEAADGVRRCLPPAPDQLSYADATCATAIHSVYRAAGCDGDLVAPKEVSYQGRAYAVAGAVTLPVLYSKNNDGSCVVLGAPNAGYHLYQLGDEIPSSAYAAIDPQTR